MSRFRKLEWIAVSLFAAASAAPALTHEPADGKREQKIIIMSERHQEGGETEHGETRRRVSRVVIADCGGDKTEFSGSSEGKGEKARVIVCTRGETSTADRAERLEHVLERINANEDLSAEAKARIGTALRDAIARLNTAR